MNPWNRILPEDSISLPLWHIGTISQYLSRISLHELLRLSTETREALKVAFADSKVFLTQVPIPTIEDGASYPRCHLVQQKVPCITFTPKDMLLKDNRHDRPLYYTGYIGSTYIERMQVDAGSVSIISKRLLYFLGISLSRLSTMTTIIYNFNAGSSHPLGKIHLWYQIRDLKSEVTCYIIDADTSYNLLLGRPGSMLTGLCLPHSINALNMWIRQWSGWCLQIYSHSKGRRATSLILYYREKGKVVEKSFPNDIDSGNEEDSELGEDPEVSFDEEPIVAYLNDPDCNNSANNSDKWVLNEKCQFWLFLVLWWCK